jgi:ubiquitin carboxyl-terminal hydrolase 2/21
MFILIPSSILTSFNSCISNRYVFYYNICCRDSTKATESWKRYLRNEDSSIVDIFVGQLRSSLRCTVCDHVSVTLDPFWDLSLPIPSRSGTVKLSLCLEHFTREEILDGNEKPTCSKCQTRRKCTKSFSIQKFPKILVIRILFIYLKVFINC